MKFAFLLISLLTSVVSSAAPTYYVEIHGVTTGEFYPSRTGAPTYSTNGLGFTFESQMSIGPAQPPYFNYFVLKKPMDASSSKLQIAMMNLENLDRVVVTVQTVATIGTQQVTSTQKITLASSVIVNIQYDASTSDAVEIITLQWSTMQLLTSEGTGKATSLTMHCCNVPEYYTIP